MTDTEIENDRKLTELRHIADACVQLACGIYDVTNKFRKYRSVLCVNTKANTSIQE